MIMKWEPIEFYIERKKAEERKNKKEDKNNV